MLNPSTADASRDDPTIRRCIGFARAWGYGGVEVVNVFALRATEPSLLRRVRDPVGPGNDAALAAATARVDAIVIAWGVHGTLLQRDRTVPRAAQSDEVAGSRMDAVGSTAASAVPAPRYATVRDRIRLTMRRVSASIAA